MDKPTEPNQIGERVYRGTGAKATGEQAKLPPTVRDIAEAIVRGMKIWHPPGKCDKKLKQWADEVSLMSHRLRLVGNDEKADDLALLASEIRAVWTEYSIFETSFTRG